MRTGPRSFSTAVSQDETKGQESSCHGQCFRLLRSNIMTTRHDVDPAKQKETWEVSNTHAGPCLSVAVSLFPSRIFADTLTPMYRRSLPGVKGQRRFGRRTVKLKIPGISNVGCANPIPPCLALSSALPKTGHRLSRYCQPWLLYPASKPGCIETWLIRSTAGSPGWGRRRLLCRLLLTPKV